MTRDNEEAQPAQQEPVVLETVYETIIQWDEGGGKRSRRELAQRIVALYTSPQPTWQETVNGRTVKVDWKAQALELRELVRLGGIKIAELEVALAEQQEPVQQPLGYVTATEMRLFLSTGRPALVWKRTANQEGTDVSVYAAPQPAQHTWVGLTEEEIADIISLNYPAYFDVAQAIEAKLMEKNTCSA